MDFWEITKVLFRRWYIAAPLLVVTAAAGISVGVVEKPLYELTAYVQLIPATATPGPAAAPTPNNPWNEIGLDSLSTAAQLGTQDHTFLDSLKAQGNTPNFTINVGVPPSGDTFDVIGTSSKQVQDTADLAIARFTGYVQSLQTAYGVPSAQLIRTQRLDHGTNITRPNGKQLRAVIGVVGAGILITCAAAIFVDYRSRRRQIQKHPRGRSASSPDTPSVPTPRDRYRSELVTASARGGNRPASSTGPSSDPITGGSAHEATFTDFSDRPGGDIR